MLTTHEQIIFISSNSFATIFQVRFGLGYSLLCSRNRNQPGVISKTYGRRNIGSDHLYMLLMFVLAKIIASFFFRSFWPASGHTSWLSTLG